MVRVDGRGVMSMTAWDWADVCRPQGEILVYLTCAERRH